MSFPTQYTEGLKQQRLDSEGLRTTQLSSVYTAIYQALWEAGKGIGDGSSPLLAFLPSGDDFPRDEVAALFEGSFDTTQLAYAYVDFETASREAADDFVRELYGLVDAVLGKVSPILRDGLDLAETSPLFGMLPPFATAALKKIVNGELSAKTLLPVQFVANPAGKNVLRIVIAVPEQLSLVGERAAKIFKAFNEAKRTRWEREANSRIQWGSWFDAVDVFTLPNQRRLVKFDDSNDYRPHYGWAIENENGKFPADVPEGVDSRQFAYVGDAKSHYEWAPESGAASALQFWEQTTGYPRAPIKAEHNGDWFFGELSDEGAFIKIDDTEVVNVDVYYVLDKAVTVIDRQASSVAFGSLSAEERERVEKAFKKYDSDNSGSIDRKEFALLIQDLNITVTDGELDEAFRSLDQNNSGTIDFEEFVQFWTQNDTKGKNIFAAVKAGLQLQVIGGKVAQRLTRVDTRLSTIDVDTQLGTAQTERKASGITAWAVVNKQKYPNSPQSEGHWQFALGDNIGDLITSYLEMKGRPLVSLADGIRYNAHIVLPHAIVQVIRKWSGANENDLADIGIGDLYLRTALSLKPNAKVAFKTKHTISENLRSTYDDMVKELAEFLAGAGNTTFTDLDFDLVRQTLLNPSTPFHTLMEYRDSQLIQSVILNGFDFSKALKDQEMSEDEIEKFREYIALGKAGLLAAHNAEATLRQIYQDLVVNHTDPSQIRFPDQPGLPMEIITEYFAMIVFQLANYLNGPPPMFKEIIAQQITGALMADATQLAERLFDTVLVPGPKLVLEHYVRLVPAIIKLLLNINFLSSVGILSNAVIGELRIDNLNLGPALNILRNPETFEATATKALERFIVLHSEKALELAKTRTQKLEKLTAIIDKVEEIAGDDAVLPLAIPTLKRILEKRRIF